MEFDEVDNFAADDVVEEEDTEDVMAVEAAMEVLNTCMAILKWW